MEQFHIIYFLIILFLLFLFESRKVFIPWVKSRSNYSQLTLRQLFGMHLRKLDLNVMVNAHNYIQMNKLDLTLNQLEDFLLSGGKANDILQHAKNIKNDSKPFNFEEYSELYFLKYKPIKTFSLAKKDKRSLGIAGIYLVAKFSHAEIGFIELLKLKVQGIDTTLLVRAAIMLKKDGIDISKERIISLIKDRYDIMNIVNILLLSKRNNFEFPIEEAVRGDELGIDFATEINRAESIQEKVKEIRNIIYLKN
jgi:uncharacterized protein YqfA (UPF0365 family)